MKKHLKYATVLTCLTASLALADVPLPGAPKDPITQTTEQGLANVAGILIGWATTVVVAIYRSL